MSAGAGEDRCEYINEVKEVNEKTKLAYEAIGRLNVLELMKNYHPILCGTFPIGINTDSSDLDIIMEVQDFAGFEKTAKSLFGHLENFRMKRLVSREKPAVKVNFKYAGFEFELFGQAVPSKEQDAYLHMVIEEAVMRQNPWVKAKVIQLKKSGQKTEPAFCTVLGLEGDPYIGLLNYGRKMGMI